jgi:hypothetical protein
MMNHHDSIENIVDQCLLRLDAGESIADCVRDFPQQAAELGPMLVAAMTLQQWQAPTLAPSVREAARIKAHAALRSQQHSNRPGDKQGFAMVWGGGLLLRFGFALLVALALLSSSVAYAQASLPGDPLYGLKRASEQVNASLASSAEQRLQNQFGLADRRLEETSLLLQQGRSLDPNLPADLMRNYALAQAAIEQADPAERSRLKDMYVNLAREQQRTLATTLEQIPASSDRDLLQQAQEANESALNQAAPPPVMPTATPSPTREPMPTRPAATPRPLIGTPNNDDPANDDRGPDDNRGDGDRDDDRNDDDPRVRGADDEDNREPSNSDDRDDDRDDDNRGSDNNNGGSGGDNRGLDNNNGDNRGPGNDSSDNGGDNREPDNNSGGNGGDNRGPGSDSGNNTGPDSSSGNGSNSNEGGNNGDKRSPDHSDGGATAAARMARTTSAVPTTAVAARMAAKTIPGATAAAARMARTTKRSPDDGGGGENGGKDDNGGDSGSGENGGKDGGKDDSRGDSGGDTGRNDSGSKDDGKDDGGKEDR